MFLSPKYGIWAHLKPETHRGAHVSLRVPFVGNQATTGLGTHPHQPPVNMPLSPITPRRMGGSHVDVSKRFGLKVSPGPVPTALDESRTASYKRLSRET